MRLPGRDRRHQLSASLLVTWMIPLTLGCALFSKPEPTPAVEDEGCSDDHADAWEPDPRGAHIEFSGEPADGDCNTAQWFSGGAGQGGDVFHFEPELRVDSSTLELPDFPSVQWEIARDGEVWGGGWVEVYEEDIVRHADSFVVRPRAFIQADDRGKNFVLKMTMELNQLEPGAETVETVEVVAQAGVYIR